MTIDFDQKLNNLSRIISQCDGPFTSIKSQIKHEIRLNLCEFCEALSIDYASDGNMS